MAPSEVDQSLARFAEARQAFREQRLDHARALLETLVTEAPLFAPALQLLAAVRRLSGAEVAGTRALLEQALVASKRSPSAVSDLGFFLHEQGAPEEAAKHFSEALHHALIDASEALDGLIACTQILGGTRVKEATEQLSRPFHELQQRLDVLNELTDG